MKTGRYPVASIVLLILIGAKLAVKYFFPENYDSLLPVFDAILMAAAIIFTVYYVRIFVTTWLNNRRENTDQEK